MMNPDATTHPRLETQLRELSAVLDKLGRAVDDLVPSRATFWSGQARAAYDARVADIDRDLERVLELLRLARNSTVLAIAEGARHV